MPSATSRAIPVSDLDLRLSRIGRGERLITWGRVALAAFSLLAVWLDPTEPARLARVAYVVLLGYLLYSLGLALAETSSLRPLQSLRIVTHGVDLAVAVLVSSLTGVISPFFTLFVFLLVAATLRWQWEGTLWTGAVVVVAYVALGLYESVRFGDVSFAINHLIVSGSLAVVAVLLGFLGSWEERLRRDLADLARAPHLRYSSFDEASRESLRQAASILRATRAMLVWEETEEPWLETLEWSAGEVRYERLRHGVISPLVAEPLEESAFLCLDLASDPPAVLHTADRGLTMWRGQPFHAELTRRAAARNVLSVPVAGEGVNGRLFAFDKPRLNSDDLVVGLLLGRQISATLEQHVLVRETETSAATAERMRLARELHDGITQSLAGAALQISGLRRLVAVDPTGAEKRLDEIESLLLNEQRELRLFMQELRPSSAGSERDGSLETRLEELCQRVSRLWGVEVELEVTGEIAVPLQREVYRLVHEALINAARHSHASQVRVTAAMSPEGARLRVVDDGRGFPFHGLYDLATLNAGKIGPVSLKERVASLRGDLVVRSSDHGAEIEITLPISAAQGAT